MDASMQSADTRAELAGLRRRAYGPDADIARDPHAVARLAELETGEKVVPAAGDPAPHPAPPARRARLRWGAAAVLAAALAGVGTALGVGALVAPRPDATLHVVEMGVETDPSLATGWPDAFLVAAGDLRAFEEYRGFRAWAGPASDGLSCLFVTHPDLGVIAHSCTTPSIRPIVDAHLGNGTVSLGGGTRNMVRFELVGAVVHVFDRPVSDAEEAS